MDTRENNRGSRYKEPSVQLDVEPDKALLFSGKILDLMNLVFGKRNKPDFISAENQNIQGLLLTINDWWLLETRGGKELPTITGAWLIGSITAYSMVLARQLKLRAGEHQAPGAKSRMRASNDAHGMLKLLWHWTERARGIDDDAALKSYLKGTATTLIREQAILADYESYVRGLYRNPAVAKIFTMTTDIGGTGDYRLYYDCRPDGSEQAYAGANNAGKLFIKAMIGAKRSAQRRQSPEGTDKTGKGT
jgi:hypothetical protein